MTIFLLCAFFIFLDYGSFYWNKENCSLYLSQSASERSNSLKYVSVTRPRIYLVAVSLCIIVIVGMNYSDRTIVYTFLILYLMMTMYSIVEILWYTKDR